MYNRIAPLWNYIKLWITVRILEKIEENTGKTPPGMEETETEFREATIAAFATLVDTYEKREIMLEAIAEGIDRDYGERQNENETAIHENARHLQTVLANDETEQDSPKKLIDVFHDPESSFKDFLNAAHQLKEHAATMLPPELPHWRHSGRGEGELYTNHLSRIGSVTILLQACESNANPPLYTWLVTLFNNELKDGHKHSRMQTLTNKTREEARNAAVDFAVTFAPELTTAKLAQLRLTETLHWTVSHNSAGRLQQTAALGDHIGILLQHAQKPDEWEVTLTHTIAPQRRRRFDAPDQDERLQAEHMAVLYERDIRDMYPESDAAIDWHKISRTTKG